MELQEQVRTVVERTRQRSGWPVRRTLAALEVPPASFYRWRRTAGGAGAGAGTAPLTCDAPGTAAEALPRRGPARSLYELLPEERKAIVDYALKHPEVRHRELAWKMLDDGVCAVSSSSVYRVLDAARLVCRWKAKPQPRGGDRPPPPARPDELWQTDIRYVKAAARNYYLLSFVDACSRYVVYHELLRSMDGRSVSIAAAAALAALSGRTRPLLKAGSHAQGPVIQSDHGSGFMAREFAATLAESGVGHTLIRPHTPTDNAIVERYHRTIGEKIDERL